MRILNCLFILLAFQQVAASDHSSKSEQKKREWFQANAGLGGLTLSYRNFQTYDNLDEQGGVFLAVMDLSYEEATALLKNSFFNWWSFQQLPNEVAKATYLMLDSKEGEIPRKMFPNLSDKISYIYIPGANKRRLYLLQEVYKEHPKLYYFYLKH